MEVIWSDDAKYDYHENIDYLLREWSENSAVDFIEEVKTILEIIKSQPELFPLSDHQTIRRAVIRKQITLFYKVEEEIIYIVRLWNNYKDPESRSL